MLAAAENGIWAEHLDELGMGRELVVYRVPLEGGEVWFSPVVDRSDEVSLARFLALMRYPDFLADLFVLEPYQPIPGGSRRYSWAVAERVFLGELQRRYSDPLEWQVDCLVCPDGARFPGKENWIHLDQVVFRLERCVGCGQWFLAPLHFTVLPTTLVSAYRKHLDSLGLEKALWKDSEQRIWFTLHPLMVERSMFCQACPGVHKDERGEGL